ncbi:hypothetical protein QBC47DRAFT_352484 [Echria macrotheca]|uniref:Phytochrome n=1 Tax=Echria macrotheca TaxID=438768 RepID=A0AAJ0B511_9PEZI|nr:hypothetical protein QBC47DRAFT_352484 [Echria macrotheca]
MAEPIERVFPIRLSILENSPFLRNASGSGAELSLVRIVEEPPGTEDAAPEAAPTPAADAEPSGELYQVPPTPEIVMTDDSGSTPSSESSGPLLTDRFEYATLNDGSHGVIQGTRRAFTRCEDELIHIPGAVQSYGMLVALKRHAEGVFVPRIVSENSYDICRYHPQEIFGFDSFNHVMPIFQRPLFNSQLRSVRSLYDRKDREQEPVVFAFSYFDPEGRLIPCWCAAHYIGGDVDLYVCEFELQDYSMHPHFTPQAPDVPSKGPIDTLGSDHMDIATVSSLHSRSQPVLMPDILHPSIDPDTTPVEIVSIATKIQKQFSDAGGVQELLDAIVGVVRELTNFNRVMVYKFDKDFNGSVVAELMDPKASRDVYRGLHFPSTDIPPQARQLYMLNKVRVLFDRTQQTARLIGKSAADIGVPLDLTHAYLRAMSPVHLKYLANMEVRSSMSMSLDSEGKLWGLIVCHSYGPTATRVPFTVRELCYFVGVAASTCLEKLLNADKLQARRIIDTLRYTKNPNECITASSEELLTLFDADCGFLVIDGEARTIGRLASYTEAVTMLRYLFFRRPDTILFSSDLSHDYKDIHYPGGFKSIAGALYIPLSGTTDDCVLFFRRNQLREVHWAGKPSLEGKVGTLEPRNSFRKWTEIVDGTSRSWTPEQANIAAMAQLVYGSFIRVWREKEAAVKETRLKRLLLHDASHQVRTPLNAVINYLEIALEKPIEESTKEALTMSYSASKSLIYVIDDLLNLTGSTSGSIPLLCDPFDVSSCLEQTLDPLKRLAREKGIEIAARAVTPFVRFLRGDAPNLQRAISILVANAIEHTTNGHVVVEWGELTRLPNTSTMRVSVSDSGPGLTERELDDMFQDFEQVPDEDPASEESSANRGDAIKVGVGLAFVARYVKQRNGQLKVCSIKDKGSTFAIEVPFLIASRGATPSSPSTLAARRDASPLPTLPMPDRPPMIPSASSVPTAPATAPAEPPSSSRAKEVSPPIVASTPRLSPMIGSISTPSTSSFTIIVADDNYINVQILSKRLTKMGHRVLVGRDGQECFNVFVANQATVDFVLMDLNMPVVDGWASAMMIRAQERMRPTPSRAVQSCGHTPIFAVSGMLRRGDERRYVDAGFDGWMPKPINMRQLAMCLVGAWDRCAQGCAAYNETYFELGGWFPYDQIDEAAASSAAASRAATQPPTPAPDSGPGPGTVPGPGVKPAAGGGGGAQEAEAYPPLPVTPAVDNGQAFTPGITPGIQQRGYYTPSVSSMPPSVACEAARDEGSGYFFRSLDAQIASSQEESLPSGTPTSRGDETPKKELGEIPTTPDCHPPIASPWRVD